MGHLITKFSEPLLQCRGSVTDMLTNRRRKRKRSTDSNSLAEDERNSELQSPKKKRLLTTTKYIYQALFKEQRNCDVSVLALGRVWNLHKVYLSQSPYFYSMFNGSWRESNEDFVHIKIVDENITTDALEAVFGALYCDEIEINSKNVIAIVATATLFNLESIIDKCSEVMVDSVSVENAVSYYEAAVQYGCLSAKKAAFTWLELNLLSAYNRNSKLMREFSTDLMTELVASSDLFVMQTEFSLYTLLRTWMYLRLNPDYNPENIPQQDNEREPAHFSAIHQYFSERTDETCFLATQNGQPFVRPFQMLRTQYLANHYMDLKIVLNDNIIPKQWMHNHVLSQWNTILRVDHMPEEGPKNLDEMVFNKNCMRCGRFLLEPGYQKWRWTGFNVGLDLILIMDSRVLSIRRHHRNEHERLLSLQTKRQFMIRASIASINADRQPRRIQKSNLASLSLEKNEEVTLMVMEQDLEYPLLISVNLLAIPPVNQSFKQQIRNADDETNNSVPISEIGANCCRSSTPTSAAMVNDTSDDSAVFVISPADTPAPTVVQAHPAAAFLSQLANARSADDNQSTITTTSAASSAASMEFL